MSANNENNLPVPDDLAQIKPAKKRGLSMSEIRYQRALLALEKEFCKEKMNVSVMKIRNYSIFGSSSSSSSKGGGMSGVVGFAGKLLSKANYFDYAMIGFSIFNSVRKLYRKVKNK